MVSTYYVTLHIPELPDPYDPEGAFDESEEDDIFEIEEDNETSVVFDRGSRTTPR